MRLFGCPVTILNTIDHLGKFDGKVDEGFFVGYSTNRKVFRVFNNRTRIVEENLHVKFSEDKPITACGIANVAKSSVRRGKRGKKHSNFDRGTKWVYRNKKEERGIVIKNKARLVDQGYTQEEVKNPIFHSKTKHIEIRHHFIRDSNEKKLIQMIKIHTDKNVADLLTKAFDVKMVNREVQLQALVDGKKVIITESTIRRDLHLEDAEGIEYLLNADIFEQLALKYGEEMCESSVKFQKYPRFCAESFSQEEMGEGSTMPTDPHHTPIIQPSTSQPQKKQSRRKQRKDTEIPQSSGPTEPILMRLRLPMRENVLHRS
ncbi:retrovirus-related pol polyprotein from transposon TNT 1-94 [Tanacetum coccineum]